MELAAAEQRQPKAACSQGKGGSAAYLLLVCALTEEYPSLDPRKLLPKETKTSKGAGEREIPYWAEAQKAVK